jgi:hypothetical protein
MCGGAGPRGGIRRRQRLNRREETQLCTNCTKISYSKALSSGPSLRYDLVWMAVLQTEGFLMADDKQQTTLARLAELTEERRKIMDQLIQGGETKVTLQAIRLMCL